MSIPTGESRAEARASRPAPTLRVECRRLEQARPSVDQHLTCPYCFGARADVESGDHRRFCDFEPGRDPVSFGFPPGFFDHR
jgi:hypothetical protein